MEENPSPGRYSPERMTSIEQSFRAELVGLLPRLRRFGRALTRHREDADDVVQIALERALNHHAQWEPGTRLDSWMFRIMKNAWIDEVRARRRSSEVVMSEDEIESVGVATPDSHLESLAIRAAMHQLGEDQRLAVSLVLVEGMAYKEAAEVLEIPIGTLTSRLARARERLQELLAEDAGGSERGR
ncbi:MAG TPA: sigma-70 family RNA polymerase sigma factor [Burkholderiaceae bacterium]